MESFDDDTLRRAAGWKAMKQGRDLLASGAVGEVKRDGSTWTGKVRVGGRVVGVALKCAGRDELAGRCPCPEGQRGVLCGHAVALVLAEREENRNQKSRAVAKKATYTDDVIRQDNLLSGSDKDQNACYLVSTLEDVIVSRVNNSLPIHLQPFTGNRQSPCVPFPALAAWLAGLGLEGLPPSLRVPVGELAGLLALLADHRAVLRTPGGDLACRAEAHRPAATARLLEKARIALMISPDGRSWWPGGWVIKGTEAFPPPVFDALPARLREALDRAAAAGGECVMPLEEYIEHAEALHASLNLDASEADPEIDRRPPGVTLSIDGSLSRLAAELDFDYGVEMGDGSLAQAPGGGLRLRRRDVEDGARDQLDQWGFRRGSAGRFILQGESSVLSFYASCGRLIPSAWQVRWGQRIQSETAGVERAAFRFASGRGEPGWLEGEVRCETPSGTQISRHELEKMLRVGRGHFQTGDGRKVVVDLEQADDLGEFWLDIGADQVAPGVFRFDATQQAYLAATLGELSRPTGVDDAAWLAAAGSAGPLLRPYQREGVGWLVGQARAGLGALLGDDMGLGKTLQTLCFLAWQKREHPQAGPPLVVCPTSLLATWEGEVRRFFPDWRVLIQHGAGRSDYWEVMSAADLVLTSYALLGRDLDYYRQRQWPTVVLDEASLIRNPDTRAAKAARRLQASTRIALTGTPVENGVRDLWSVFAFLQPGYLGGREDFRQRYERVLQGRGDARVARRLRRRVAPFFLRRRKEDVAPDLPARIEEVDQATMGAKQAGLYNALLRESRDRLGKALSRRGFEGARMDILTALLRLRQVCCDPALLPGDGGEGIPSAKREQFRERLREAVEGGHKVLVFSQFTSMLDLLREDVEALGADCLMLTGSTRDRGALVRRFQEGEADVFLLSLKAGGYGLTLTQADTVMLYDPWWNPAVEAQAIDRAHRIGQVRPVTAYRFVVRDSIEQKILKLQEQKRNLSRLTVGDDGDFGQGSFSENELRDLLGL